AETNTSGFNEKQEVARLLTRRSLLLHFSRHLESLFLKSYAHHNRVRMRLTLALGLIFYLLAGVADLHLNPASLDILLMIRYVLIAPVIAAALAAAYWIRRDTAMQSVYTVAALAAGAGTAITVYLNPQSAGYAYSLGILAILFYIYVISGMRIGFSLACALMVSSLYLAGAFMSQAFPDAVMQMIVAQVIVINLAGAYAGYRLEKEARRSFLDGRMVRLLNEEMIELVGVDELTGLANRRRLDEFYANTWARAQRDKAELSLLFVDVDYLQQLNDHLGRSIGDICLRKLGAVIQHYQKRPGDIAARYEGGKFLVILYGCNERHGKVIAGNLRQDIESLNLMNPASPTGWTITVSIGVHSVVPSRKQSPASALLATDTLLYMAKKRGRNRVVADADAATGNSPDAKSDQASADKTVVLPRLKVVK
ncbi:MAG: GGDEF domain-containing protein, partial [Gammaproteobacteria bacterium]